MVLLQSLAGDKGRVDDDADAQGEIQIGQVNRLVGKLL
jgi:hypothetical protein